MAGMRLDNGQSPTRAIFERLRPLWESKSLDDQDWVFVLICLRKIELECSQCPYCAEGNKNVAV